MVSPVSPKAIEWKKVNLVIQIRTMEHIKIHHGHLNSRWLCLNFSQERYRHKYKGEREREREEKTKTLLPFNILYVYVCARLGKQ